MTIQDEMIPLARIHGVDDLRLDAVNYPHCGTEDVVVKVSQCGICGTDLGFLAAGGMMGPGAPLPIGHELWGTVHELGSGVGHLERGDKVVVQPMSNNNLIGNGGSEGGFSPYLLVRGAASHPDATLRIAEGVPDRFGALVEPLSVALHGVNRLAIEALDTAVIFGAGPIGLSLLLILQQRGLSDIVVVDVSSHRLALAAQLGAHAIHAEDDDLGSRLLELHGSRSYFGSPMAGSSVYFEATGVGSVFEKIVALAGPGSRIGLTGVHKRPVSLDLTQLLAKEVSIVPAMGYQHEFDEVMALLASGALDPSALVTHHYPLSELQTAFDTARNTERAVKVIIDCQA